MIYTRENKGLYDKENDKVVKEILPLNDIIIALFLYKIISISLGFKSCTIFLLYMHNFDDIRNTPWF